MLDAIIIVILMAVMISFAAFFHYSRKSKKLSEGNKAFYIKKLSEISKLTPFQKLLKCDALLHQILSDLGYKGSLGEQLKQKPYILGKKLDTFWRVHKARNRAAHEMSTSSESYLDKDARKYENEIRNIL